MKHETLNIKQSHGFTLVELLITIAIIGILAAMILPRLFGPTEQGRSSEARNMLGAIRQLEEAYRSGAAGDGNYLHIPNANTDAAAIALWVQLGMENPNLSPGYFSYHAEAINGATPPTLLVHAVRNDVPADNPDSTKQMCLNNLGIWSGNYPQSPKNPDGCECGDPNCPGPEPCC